MKECAGGAKSVGTGGDEDESAVAVAVAGVATERGGLALHVMYK